MATKKTAKASKTTKTAKTNGANEDRTADETVTPTLPALKGEDAPITIPSNLTPENLEGLDEYLAATAGESSEPCKYKKGSWRRLDATVLPLGTEMAVDVASISDGHVKWVNKKPVGSDMRRCIAGPPTPRDELDDTDESLWPVDPTSGEKRDPWARTMSVVLKDPATFEQFRFSTSSVGGLNEIRRLLRSIRNAIARGETKIPIVALDSDSYMHPIYDEVFIPKLPLKAWKSEAELLGGEDPGPLPDDSIPF
jgi:hypothetical protein